MSIPKFFFSSLFFLFLLITANANADTVLQDIYGKKIPFSSLNGKWVFINYWASWCQPCLEEIPELNRFYEQNKTNNVAIYAVNYDALPIEEQEMLIAQFDIHYPALKEDPAEPLHLGAINGVPVTFVFNPQGRLIGTLYGGQTLRSLTLALKSK